MKNKYYIFLTILVSILISSSVLFAHEFWLISNKFRVSINESIALNYYVGEDFMGELWKRKKDKTLKLTHFTGQKQIDLTELSIKSDTNAISLKFENEGTHVLALETKNSFIALEAQKFNEYLKDDGIDNIYALLKPKGRVFITSCTPVPNSDIDQFMQSRINTTERYTGLMYYEYHKTFGKDQASRIAAAHSLGQMHNLGSTSSLPSPGYKQEIIDLESAQQYFYLHIWIRIMSDFHIASSL